MSTANDTGAERPNAAMLNGRHLGHHVFFKEVSLPSIYGTVPRTMVSVTRARVTVINSKTCLCCRWLKAYLGRSRWSCLDAASIQHSSSIQPRRNGIVRNGSPGLHGCVGSFVPIFRLLVTPPLPPPTPTLVLAASSPTFILCPSHLAIVGTYPM
jgi:hypothetical protein